MENIDKIIKLKVLEIIIAFCFIFVFSFVWYSLNQSDTFKLLEADMPTNFSSLSVLYDNHYSFYPMEDSLALNSIMPNSILVKNETYIDSEYAIGIKVHKNSTIYYNDVKIAISGDIHFLSDFYVYEDSNFYYFILERGNIVASYKTFEFQMWLCDHSFSLPNSTFLYEFVNLSDSSL